MVTLHEGKLRATRLLGISEVALPADLIIFVFLIENVPRMHVILNYDLSATVLEELLPGCCDLVGLFWCLKGSGRHKERWTHIYVV